MEKKRLITGQPNEFEHAQMIRKQFLLILSSSKEPSEAQDVGGYHVKLLAELCGVFDSHTGGFPASSAASWESSVAA